jgi:hypothetical protein
MKKSPQRVFDDLVHHAFSSSICRSGRTLQESVARGRDYDELPDWLKPGWLVSRLSSEEREALQGLTGEMASNVRPDEIKMWAELSK